MISYVKIKNFRIHSSYEVNLLDGVNVIIGNNGVGKTSVIEAIYIVLTGKSWRSNLEVITKQGKGWWRVDIKDDDINKTIKFNGKKSFEINSKEYLKLPKKERIPVVMFEPDDLNLIYGSPARRRRWLDKLLKSIDDEYHLVFNKFEKVLKQRNSLLKKQATYDELFVWDLQFADLASQVIKKRKAIIKIFNEKIPNEYKKIANKEEILELKYQSDGINTKQKIINQLQENYQMELFTKSTSIGPQKHDVLVSFKNQLAATSASRGENRSIISSLKNIEYGIKKTNHHNPLILLDDIMSELDENHQINLLNGFEGSQVIITGVDLPKIKNKNINIIRL